MGCVRDATTDGGGPWVSLDPGGASFYFSAFLPLNSDFHSMMIPTILDTRSSDNHKPEWVKIAGADGCSSPVFIVGIGIADQYEKHIFGKGSHFFSG